MSKNSLVLTVLGADRPGLVESIAQLVADHGANWLESRMAHLAGQFAGILRVEVDADKAETLSQALAQLTGAGLDTVVHPDPGATTPSIERLPLVTLDLIGQDRPGIVRQISRVLASLGVNVEELSTGCMSAPESGQSLFHAEAKLRLPEHLTQQALRTAVEGVAADLMVDVVLADEDSP